MAQQDEQADTATKEMDIAIKILIPSYASGAIIGKSGATISQMQQDTGTRMKLSQNREFFPGSNERVLLITGSSDAVINAVDNVIQRVSTIQEPATPARGADSRHEARSQQLKLAIPSQSAGVLIGKGGENIKALQSSTPAKINISPKEADYGSVERVITITGAVDLQKEVAKTVLAKLTEDSRYLQYDNMNLAYASESTDPYGFYGAHAFHGASATPCTISIHVADSLVGAVLGKGGRAIMDIQANSGAHISVSPKGEYAPGTTDRILSITGPAAAAQSAHIMVQRRIDQATTQLVHRS